MKKISVRLYAPLLTLGLAMAALPAFAADDSFVIASADMAGGPRYMSLAPVRSGTVRVQNGLQPAPLRSDRVAMNNGFMRIDRASLRPIQAYHNVVKPAASVTILRGASSAKQEDKEITDLFADAPETSSFRDAMSGTAGGTVRHAWPLPTSVSQKFTSGYGIRRDPFHGRQAFHGGVDIAAAVGTPVLASAEGVVKKVENQKGLGKYVSVQHRDGTESFYGHLSAQSVRVGQRVMQGQKVGELGSTGRSTGPHLDYRIKKNGETFNPMTVLRAPNATVAMR